MLIFLGFKEQYIEEYSQMYFFVKEAARLSMKQ